jgi:serine protease Do
MMSNEQIQEWVELYNLDLLEGDDKTRFETELSNNPALRKMLNEQKAFVRLVNHKTSKEVIRNQMQMIHAQKQTTVRKIADGMQVHVNKYWKTASVAASVALIASMLTFTLAKNSYDKQLNSQTQLLGMVVNKVNKNEKKLNSLNKTVQENMPEQPTGNSKVSGTCFVLKNNGYVITNAHVVNGNSKIYVFTNNNTIGHKASVVKIDQDLDLALLKIDEKDFSFSKTNLPYGISNKDGGMSQKVYTLGYPKSSIVYNEGYISSSTGRDDEENRYEMELPSSPGVSGSPVFDENGNIVAIINSKESIGNSTTYALKSTELKKFFSDLDSLHLNTAASKLNGLNRPQQVKAIQDFVMEVKVY